MNLSASALLQARSIYALILRKIRTDYAGSRAGYAWAIIEPIVWVFVLRLAIKHNSAATIPPIGTSFEVFFTTGIVLARTWRAACSKIVAILVRAKPERLPTLHRMDSICATLILEILTGAVALTIMLCLFQAFGYDAVPYNLTICILAFVLCGVFALSFGLTFAMINILAPGIDHFRGIFFLIMFFTSGFSFVVDRMPAALRQVVTWNPLLHIIEFFREGFYRGYECRSLSLIYLMGFIVATLLIGAAGERALRRHTRKTDGAGEEDVEMA